jgi:hypothetical protein
VKKKRPGGLANGGTYFTLGAPATYSPTLGRWQHVLVMITDQANQTVAIVLYINGHRMLSAVDSGIGGEALTEPGAVGIRGDNAEFEFANFRVRALNSPSGPRSRTVVPTSAQPSQSTHHHRGRLRAATRPHSVARGHPRHRRRARR